jgi:hypothetical protein
MHISLSSKNAMKTVSGFAPYLFNLSKGAVGLHFFSLKARQSSLFAISISLWLIRLVLAVTYSGVKHMDQGK